MVTFRATLQLNGKTATGIRVPDEVVAALGTHKRPAVHATIGGYTYRSSVASMRGIFMLPVSADVREQAVWRRATSWTSRSSSTPSRAR